MTPEAKLLYAIFKQIISDYVKLDPESDSSSADLVGTEAEDFITAEDIIFNGEKLYYGDLEFTFEDLCILFQPYTYSTYKEIKRNISLKAIDY